MTDKQENYWLAHDFFQQAVCCYEQKDYKNALINYTKVIELAPDFKYEIGRNTNIYNERGVCYYQLENYEQALADFSEAIAIELNSSNYLVAIFYFYFYYRAIFYFYYQLENYEQALADFSKAIAIELNSSTYRAAIFYFNRGVCYYKQKNYKDAVSDFSKSIELIPHYFLGYFNRARCYYEQKNYEYAIDDFSKAIELNSDNINAYYHRGLCFSKLGDYKSAFLNYEKIIEVNHEYDKNICNINVYIDFPQYFTKMFGAFAENESDLVGYNKDEKNLPLLEDYNKEIELDLNNSISYFNRGNFYYKDRKYELAVVDYTKAIELNPTYIFAYFKRANCYYGQKNYKLCLDDCTRIIELEHDAPHTYNLQGLCYYEQENYELALDSFTKAINLKPDNHYFYGNRADCYQKQKNYKLALDDFSKAIELMLKIPEDNRGYDLYYPYINRASCYYKQESYELAANDYTEAIEIGDNHTDYANRGLCYFNLGHYEKALADFTEYLESLPDDIIFDSSSAYYDRSLCYYNLGNYDSSLNDIDNAIKYCKSLETKKDYCQTAKIIACNAKKYDEARDYIEQMFENVDSKEKQHKDVYLQEINQAREIYKKNTELEEKNKQLELETQEKEAAQKQVEEKNKELNNLIAMFAHNFLGTLQCIRSNAEHDNNPKVHLKTVKMMSGALTAFSIISADDEKLIEQLKQDKTGEINLQQNLANNLALAISQLLSKTNKDKIINLYLNYLQKTAQIKPETNAEDLRFNDDDWEKWDKLQQQWEDEFNALFSETVDLSRLKAWIETNFFPIQIIGFNDYNIRFKEFSITDSIFLVIFMEIVVNALKYTDASQNKPLIMTLCKQDQHYKLTCENPSANETNRGSHKGTDFLKSIAHKVNGQFITESTEHSFKSTFIIPAELLE